MGKNLTVAGMSLTPGSKKRGFIHVGKSDIRMPVTLLCGERPGPAVLISAGVHNAEYVGIQAVTELADELLPQKIKGSVVMIHLVNTTGFEHRTMSVVYEDQKNLNRCFPGRPDGTAGERICDTIVSQVFPYVDYYVDLHGGDGYESLTPYVYCQGAASAAVAGKSREMAEMTDVRYLVVSNTGTGGAYNYAGSIGIPGILLERGCMGRWSREEVAADKKDVRNILRYLGVMEDAVEPVKHRPVQVADVVYEEAPVTGCWYPCRAAGDSFKKGEILGVIKDYFGETLHICRAPEDGIILFQVMSLNVLKNGPMITYGSLSG